MTDNDIMEALECCTNPKVHKKCPRAKFVDVCNDGCIHLLMKQALDLINRQKAEIEKLKEQLDGETVKNMRLGHESEAKLDKIHYLKTEIDMLQEENCKQAEMINALIKGQESLTNYIDILTRR